MRMRITIQGSDRAIKKLQKLGAGAKDFTRELDEVGTYLKKFTEEDVFESEGGVINEKWRPLSVNYGYKKRNEYPGRGILERSGALRYGFRFISQPMKMKIWNPIEYARAHQKGRPEINLPARVFFKVDDARRKKIVDIIHKGFMRRVANA